MKTLKPVNQSFHIPEPRPGDRRKRNTWGVLVGFGKAYSAFYRKQDRAKSKRS